jgi:hypothetical protein
MPELNLKDIRKDLRWPELRLPEMTRDDIAKALGEARKEMADVRRDFNEFRREFEMPKVDLSTVDVSKIDVADVAKEARAVGRDMSKAVGKNVDKGRKEALKAAQKAGIVKKTSRIPFVIGGLITMGLVGWALSTPSVKERLKSAAQQARERIDEMRASRTGEDAQAFDAASPAEVEASPYSGAIAPTDSPFAEPPSDLPAGLGAPTKTVARAKPKVAGATKATNGSSSVSEEEPTTA